jgi:hypothetical protein
MKPSLPSAADLFSKSAKPAFLKGVLDKRPVRKAAGEAQIVKGPVMNSSEYDPIEQYDYFASTKDAILDHWNAPQELVDKEAANDRNKLTKIHDTRRKAVLGLKATRNDKPKPRKRVKTYEG